MFQPVESFSPAFGEPLIPNPVQRFTIEMDHSLGKIVVRFFAENVGETFAAGLLPEHGMPSLALFWRHGSDAARVRS